MVAIVSLNYDAADLISADKMLIKKSDKVISAGSCFASNLVPYLEKSGLTYHRTEVVHPAFSDNADEELGYAKFSAAYGNIYTVRQLLQLLRRCRGQFSPLESYWIDMGTLIDPYRPGLKHRARSVQEFHALTRQHLQKTLQAFKEATVFVLTLGLTEGWVSRQMVRSFRLALASSRASTTRSNTNFTTSRSLKSSRIWQPSSPRSAKSIRG